MASCQECGASCQGSLCQACEVELAAERRHGVPSDHTDETWSVAQQGLGEGGVDGQATLDGGIRPSGGTDE